MCGFPGVGKSTLINTMLGAINSSDYSVADVSTPTMQVAPENRLYDVHPVGRHTGPTDMLSIVVHEI